MDFTSSTAASLLGSDCCRDHCPPALYKRKTVPGRTSQKRIRKTKAKMYPVCGAIPRSGKKDSRNGRNIDLVRVELFLKTWEPDTEREQKGFPKTPPLFQDRKLLRLSPGTNELGFVPLETGLDTHSEQKAGFCPIGRDRVNNYWHAHYCKIVSSCTNLGTASSLRKSHRPSLLEDRAQIFRVNILCSASVSERRNLTWVPASCPVTAMLHPALP